MKLKGGWFRTGWHGSDRSEVEPNRREEQLLREEIRKAHKDWLMAHAQFDFAVGQDQVDYAIFFLEAAEKRYDMLLRQVKQLHHDAREHGSLAEVQQWSSSM